MTPQAYVLSVHPDAVAFPPDGRRGWKVYRRAGGAWIALSASWDTEEGAWRDAGERLRSRFNMKGVFHALESD